LCGFCLLWPIYAQGPLNEIRPCAKTLLFVHGSAAATPRPRHLARGTSLAAPRPRHLARGTSPAAATLLRGEIIFPDGAGKTNFPAPHFLRHPTPRRPFPTAPAPHPISSVKCKMLKHNLLRKRGVSVFDTLLLCNTLKISILHFTLLVPLKKVYQNRVNL